jgi:anti-sigma regulatory factor (Ser/Thr protein kinase)
MNAARLRWAAETGRLDEVMTWFAGRCTELSVLPELAARLAVVVEELASNVAVHGGQPPPTVEIGLDGTTSSFELTVEDDGVAFDPTAVPLAEPSGDADQRQIGGLGVLLARSQMDEVSYTRQEGRNRLTLRKRR